MEILTKWFEDSLESKRWFWPESKYNRLGTKYKIRLYTEAMVEISRS